MLLHYGALEYYKIRITSELDFISGKTDLGTSKNFNNNGSQFKFSIFINMVLEALVTSVTCLPPFGPPEII